MASEHSTQSRGQPSTEGEVTLFIEKTPEQGRQRPETSAGANLGQQQRDPAQADQIMDHLLYSAAKRGNVAKFMELTNNGVLLPVVLGQRSPSGNTLLHAVAENDDIIRAIIDSVPDDLISQGNSSGETPLHIAARAGNLRAVELLLPHSNPRATDRKGNSALHEAVRNRHCEVIRQLVSKDPNPLYYCNDDGKSPWCVAVETGDLEVLKLLLEAPNPVITGNLDPDNYRRDLKIFPRDFGMSPPHGAVLYQNIDMLREMSEKKPWLFGGTDAKGRNPLHFAACTNYLDGVKFLIEKFPLSALDKDKDGYLPIHVASMMDHVRIVEELLQQWPDDPTEFRAGRGENILHVSARYGCISTVKYVLKSPKLGHLINARDFDLNTPLHLAARHCQPSVLLPLARDRRADLKLVNRRNMTALDEIEKKINETDAPLQKRLTQTILRSAEAPRSKEWAIYDEFYRNPRKGMRPPKREKLNEVANTRMIVATVVATMTFASGFSIPGGYHSSNSAAGIAVLLHEPMYNVFVICNSIAMYSSIITIVILLWTQINDPYTMQSALRISRLPLLVTLATMPVAFMAGVFVSVTKLAWLSIFVLVLGSVALFIILSFYLLMYIPLGCKHPLIRRFTDLIILAGISLSRSWPAADRSTAGRSTAGRSTAPIAYCR